MNNLKCETGIAGNRGTAVKSDCYVEISLTKSGGIEIDLHSKVEKLFGDSIRELINNMMEFYQIGNAKVYIEDFGALNFVIAARIEAAIKQIINDERPFLFEILKQNRYSTERNRFRITRLYLPGNNPSLMINAGIHKPNGIILDLEDAVAADKKYESKFLVRNALRQVDFYGAERMVRINQIPAGIDDLDFVIGNFVNLILIPKCESAAQVKAVNEKIFSIKIQNSLEENIWLMPIIESALGVLNAYEIASSCENVVAMAIGLEDYTNDLGTKRTQKANETFFARSMVVNACRAAGIQPIDSVFSDINDMDALASNAKTSKALGFDGMGCIHPRQINVIMDNFSPDNDDIRKAQQIVHAFIKAEENGLGVVSIGSKMIDAPIVKRAHNTINLAVRLGKIDADWLQNYNGNN